MIVDGSSYSIEIMHNGAYTLKSYTSPYFRNPNCVEAKEICNFVELMRQLPGSLAQHNSLSATLKPGNTYTQDGFLFISVPQKANRIKFRFLQLKYNRYKRRHSE